MLSYKYTLPIAFALIGYILTSKVWIKFLDKLNPIYGLLIYYTVLTITILILQFFGLIIADIPFTSFRYTVGSILIMFSFFLIFDWTSCYVNLITKGECTDKDMSGVYLQSEDGATFYLWSKLLGIKNEDLLQHIEKLRILTYVITPLVLTFIGSLLISDKIVLSIFN